MSRRDAEYAMDRTDGKYLDGRELRVALARYERPIDERGGGYRGRGRFVWHFSFTKDDISLFPNQLMKILVIFVQIQEAECASSCQQSGSLLRAALVESFPVVAAHLS